MPKEDIHKVGKKREVPRTFSSHLSLSIFSLTTSSAPLTDCKWIHGHPHSKLLVMLKPHGSSKTGAALIYYVHLLKRQITPPWMHPPMTPAYPKKLRSQFAHMQSTLYYLRSTFSLSSRSSLSFFSPSKHWNEKRTTYSCHKTFPLELANKWFPKCRATFPNDQAKNWTMTQGLLPACVPRKAAELQRLTVAAHPKH